MTKLIAASITAALFTSFCTQAVTAQNINVQVSKTYNLKDFTPSSNAILPAGHQVEVNINDGVITIHQKFGSQLGYTANVNRARYSLTLNKRDADLKLVKENKLEGGESVFGPIAAQIVNVNGKVFLLYTKPTDDNEKDSESSYKMYAAEVNQQSLELNQPKEQLTLEKLNIGFGGLATYTQNSRFVFKASPDSSKFLVFVNSGVNTLIHMAILDKDFNTLWSKHDKIDDGTSVVVSDVCLNNTGNVFLAYTKNLKGNEYRKQVAAHSSTQKKEYRISSPTIWIRNTILTPSKFSNNVYVSSTLGGKSENIASIVIFKIDGLDFKLSPYKTIAFDEALVQKFDDAKWGSTRDKSFGIEGLDLKGFEMEDSSLALIGQAHKTFIGGRGISYETCGSFLTIRFKNGTPIISTIPRSTALDDRPGIMYYTPFAYKNKLVLLYNDMPENFEIDSWKKISSNNIYSKYILAMATIDENGKVERKAIIDDRNNNSITIGRDMKLIAPNKLVTKSYEIKGFGFNTKEPKPVTLTID